MADPAHSTYISNTLLTRKVLLKKTKTRAIQKSLPFGKWRFREKEFGRLGQKQKRIRQWIRVTGLGQRTKEEIYNILEKWDHTESPEVRDRVRHQKYPPSLLGIPNVEPEDDFHFCFLLLSLSVSLSLYQHTNSFPRQAVKDAVCMCQLH